MADGGIGEAALYSALVGGGTSAVMGGDPIKGAAMGALTGGLTSGIGGMMGADSAISSGTTAAGKDAITAAAGYTPEIAAGTPLSEVNALQGYNTSALTPNPMNPANATNVSDFLKSGSKLGALQIGMAGVGAGLGNVMQAERARYRPPGQTPYTGPLSQFRYDPSAYNPASSYLPAYRAAQGGIMDLSADHMASGGISNLGGYSDGGRMLKGPGDGMSDSIPASIGGRQPARLAEGEFVVPADVVSHLGNGSTDAGAKQLYSMMDRVRKARTGTKKQGRQIKPGKYVPV